MCDGAEGRVGACDGRWASSGTGALQRGSGRQALLVCLAEAQGGVAAKEEGEGKRSWSQVALECGNVSACDCES